jgi:hypothetical protein
MSHFIYVGGAGLIGFTEYVGGKWGIPHPGVGIEIGQTYRVSF